MLYKRARQSLGLCLTEARAPCVRVVERIVDLIRKSVHILVQRTSGTRLYLIEIIDVHT